ncbi:MAG: TetR/AcrR family transcriptional regulator [Solirubrobacterales bacterium]|nr:TetR/AcrR family transcriptional regulator [Solirubrobacterales bacterium]
MTLILDKAEAMFAERGYNVPLVEVGEYAGVDTALMRYYFGDKEELFRAVFARRGEAINELRLKALRDYRQSGEPMTLEGVIDAFIRSPFEKMHEDEGWRNYMAIVSYVNSSRGFLHKLMSQTFDHVSHELIADMRRLLPDASEDDIYWGYHFLTGSFTFSLGETGRIDKLSDGRVSSRDVLEIANRLPIVIAAGIRAMCEEAAGRRAASPGARRISGAEKLKKTATTPRTSAKRSATRPDL